MNEPDGSPEQQVDESVPIDWAEMAEEIKADLLRIDQEINQKRGELSALVTHRNNGQAALGYAERMKSEAAGKDDDR